MICASLFHFNKDAGLHAILLLTIEMRGRYILNVTLNQTSETKKNKRPRWTICAGAAGPRGLDPLNFGAESYLLPCFAVISRREN